MHADAREHSPALLHRGWNILPAVFAQAGHVFGSDDEAEAKDWAVGEQFGPGSPFGFHADCDVAQKAEQRDDSQDALPRRDHESHSVRRAPNEAPRIVATENHFCPALVCSTTNPLADGRSRPCDGLLTTLP